MDFSIFLFVTVFVGLLLTIFWPSAESKSIYAFINRLKEQNYVELQPGDWLCMKGFKVIDNVLYVQHDPYGFFTCYFTEEGVFESETYHAFTDCRHDDGIPSELPDECPRLR